MSCGGAWYHRRSQGRIGGATPPFGNDEGVALNEDNEAPPEEVIKQGGEANTQPGELIRPIEDSNSRHDDATLIDALA